MQTAIGVPDHKRAPKLRGGTKIVLIAAVIIGIGYSIWTFGVGYWLSSKHFPPLKPGKVSLLGIKTGHGFSIQVSNRIAQLVEAKGYDFTAPGQDVDTGDADGATKKRIPVDDLVYSLSGDESALSRFVTSLGGFEPTEDWPANAPIWTAENVQKAIDGDATLTGKLEQDLDTKLDGSPVRQLSTNALGKGIIVETPVPVHVMIGSEEKILHARIKRWFQTNLVSDTNSKFKELFDVPVQAKLGYYLATAKEQLADKKLEDVKASLEKLMAPSAYVEATDRAELILGSAQVILTDAFIDRASAEPSSSNDADAKVKGTAMFDLDLHVNDEGRLRLWQYSKFHPLDQLLLISNGVAIAAPRIRQELMTRDLTVVQMPDEGLVREAVDLINKK